MDRVFVYDHYLFLLYRYMMLTKRKIHLTFIHIKDKINIKIFYRVYNMCVHSYYINCKTVRWFYLKIKYINPYRIYRISHYINI